MKALGDRLREAFDYDFTTGVVRWKTSQGNNKMKPGELAGTLVDGYIKIKFEGRVYAAHRLIWFFFHDKWPHSLDHIDRNRSNNTISNLREASKSQNAFNSKLRRSTSGVRGVYPHRRKWRAAVHTNGKIRYLGLHSTKEGAMAAYKKAAMEVAGEFLGEVL